MTSREPRRPGIVVKLMLVSIALLAIPWLADRYFTRMAAFVLEGQKTALQLAAQAVATVLHDREDLFDVEGALPVPLHACSPLPLEAPVRLDGSPRDWSDLSDRTCHIPHVGVLQGEEPAGEGRKPLDLALGQRDGYLYALFQVRDDVVVHRHPRYRSLDGSDHIRIVLPDADGVEHRYLITAEGDGPVTAYEVQENWKYWEGDGRPIREVRGHWAESRGGYTVELRLPLALLPEKRVGFAVVDVDVTAGPVVSLVGTVPSHESRVIRAVALPSPGIRHILDALNLPGAKITVVDKLSHERATAGSLIDGVEAAERRRLVAGALDHRFGTPYEVAPFSGERITAAASPVRSGDRVMGAVLIEQSNQEILGFERGELEGALAAIIFACLAIAGVLWLFAWRLAWRIHRLSDEAADAIDADGRVLQVQVAAGHRAGDEIGDLSRTVTGLLGRLARYTSFLEKIPRTLRHELSNPLNSLSTSLQNLVTERPELENSKYVQSAERGVERIGEIVESLTDAASLEQALRDDEPERLDLAILLARYVENVAAGYPQRRFTLRGADEGVAITGSGFRVEQLLDKLVDNAVAFSPEGSEILLELRVSDDRVRLSVSNEGPLIPDDMHERVFDSMVSTRGSVAVDRPHLGIGLYVVRLILEHMGGRVAARNRDDGTGTVVSLDLPLAPPPRSED